MIEEESQMQTSSEAQEAAGTVIDLFEQRARDNDDGRGAGNGGRGNGNGHGDGGGNGGGGGEGGGGISLEQLLNALRQMGRMQNDFTLKATESTLSVVAETAGRLADRASADDLALAKELGETITRSLCLNARLAEATAAAIAWLDQRVAALEQEVVRLRPKGGADERGEGNLQ
jgi:hypothetical protein